MPKFIFCTGGVVSSVGKGVTVASIGRILKARGIRVSIQKLDPYINVDPGTMSPYQHGEVFVTEDGAETDLDLGHYERFVDENLTSTSSIMTGRIYSDIIAKERRGDFLGKTVQVIPHITNEVKERIKKAAKESGAEVIVAEVGGTVGDYEGLYFLESIRQMRNDVGAENVLYVHVTFLPWVEASKELKTKPTQNSVRDLRGIGIQPDVIITRADHSVSEELINKISLFCDVPKEAVIPLQTASSVYEVPLTLENYGLGKFIARRLSLDDREPDLKDWEQLIARIKSDKKKMSVGLVGKYMAMEDTYLSVTEALKSAGWFHNYDINVVWIDAQDLEKQGGEELLDGVVGIVVPGGFGSRGIEGKILAAQYAREKKKPYLGLCLGMQIATIEFARNVLNLKDANSTEMNPETTHPVIHIMEDQEKITEKGGTMRLGSYPCALDKKSKSYAAYKLSQIDERHRHRYEFNNAFRDKMKKAGLVIAGQSPDKNLVEIVEVADHPWFVGTQFHPEFKSRPNRPHPLFRDFIKACVETTTLPLE